MKFFLPLVLAMCLGLTGISSCKQDTPSSSSSSAQVDGLKIAYVNGDSILLHFDEFRRESEAMDARQRVAEQELQQKGAALEKEIMAYQKKAQSGTMTGKEMEAQERYLGSRQEAVMAERDRMAQEIMEETSTINKRLQAVLQEKLQAIKQKEGYDFILSYVEGGQILIADKKFDITDRVLLELNATSPRTTKSDTTD